MSNIRIDNAKRIARILAHSKHLDVLECIINSGANGVTSTDVANYIGAKDSSRQYANSFISDLKNIGLVKSEPLSKEVRTTPSGRLHNLNFATDFGLQVFAFIIQAGEQAYGKI